MADIIALAIKVGTSSLNAGRKDLASFGQSLSDIDKQAETTGYKIGAALTTGAKAAAGAALSAAAAIGTLTAALLNQFDDLNNMAVAYGYNVTQMSAMQRAAKTAGGSLSDFTGATQRVSRELAKGGTAFKNLGVDINSPNGGLKTASELATEVAKKYTDGSISTAQYGDAQKVLGKDLDKTAKVIADVGDAQELANSLTEKGIGIYQQAAEAGAKFGDVTDESALILQSIGSIIAARFGPAMNSVIKSFNDSYTSGGLVKQAIDAIIDTFIRLAPIAVDVGSVLAKLIASVVAGFRIAGKTIGGVVAAVVSILSGDFAGAGTIIKAMREDAGDVLNDTTKAFAGIDAFAESTKKALADAAATSLTIAAPGKGKATSGPVGVDKKAKKEQDKAAKEREKVEKEQEKLYGQLISLRQKETNEIAKQTMSDADRLALGRETQAQEKARLELEQKSAAILEKVLPQYKARAQLVINEALAQQKKAAGLENERILNEKLTEELKKQYEPLQKLALATNDKLRETRESIAQDAAASAAEQKYGATSESVAAAITRVKMAQTEKRIAGLEATEGVDDSTLALAQEKSALALLNAELQRNINLQSLKESQPIPTGSTGANTALSNVGIQLQSLPYLTGEVTAQYQAMYQRIDELAEAGVISEEERQKRITAIKQKEGQAQLSGASSVLGDIATVAKTFGKKGAKVAKAAAIGQATIQTYQAATGAYAALSSIPYIGPALGAAAAAVAIAAGIANVRKIASTDEGYKSGGYTGNVGVSQQAGVVHGKEFVVNAKATKKNRELLEMINRGYATGGYVAPLSGGSSMGISKTPRSGTTNVYDMQVSIGSVDSDERQAALLKEMHNMIVGVSREQIANETRSGGIIDKYARR